MPKPARSDVRPSFHGSHAIPIRGAMPALYSFPSLLPYGDLTPPGGGVPAKMTPLNGLKFGLHALVIFPPLKVMSRFPLARMQGALFGSYAAGSNWAIRPFASVGWRNSEWRAPNVRVRFGRIRQVSCA